MRFFISHATEDKPRVLAIVEPLTHLVSPWLDTRELGLGESLDDELRRAVVEESHAFVVFLSHTSLRKAWVATETGWALEHERALRRRKRGFVMPVLLEPLALADAPPPFERLHDKLHLPAFDAGAAGVQAASRQLGDYLFRWASEWMDVVEPQGGGDRRFVARLREDLLALKTLAYELCAWCDLSLVRLAGEPEAFERFVAAKDRYNAFTAEFMPRLPGLAHEVLQRFGRGLGDRFGDLVAFVERDLYQGAAFAVNDGVVAALNRWDAVLQHDAGALAQAEQRRGGVVVALRRVIAVTARRTSSTACRTGCSMKPESWRRCGAGTGVVPLQCVHTGDLGALIAVDLDLGGTRSRWLLDTGTTHHLVTPALELGPARAAGSSTPSTPRARPPPPACALGTVCADGTAPRCRRRSTRRGPRCTGARCSRSSSSVTVSSACCRDQGQAGSPSSASRRSVTLPPGPPNSIVAPSVTTPPVNSGFPSRASTAMLGGAPVTWT